MTMSPYGASANAGEPTIIRPAATPAIIPAFFSTDSTLLKLHRFLMKTPHRRKSAEAVQAGSYRHSEQSRWVTTPLSDTQIARRVVVGTGVDQPGSRHRPGRRVSPSRTIM